MILTFGNWTSQAEHNVLSSNVKDGTTVDVVFPLPPEWILAQGRTVLIDARFDVRLLLLCACIYIYVDLFSSVVLASPQWSINTYMHKHACIHTRRLRLQLLLMHDLMI